MTGRVWIGRLAFFAAGIVASVGAFLAAPTAITSGPVAAVQTEIRFVHADQAAHTSGALDHSYLHLSRADPGVDLTRSELATGDRITVGDVDGLKTVLEVIDVRKTALALDEAKKTKLTVVLARDVERPERHPVRFIFETGRLKGNSAHEVIEPQAL